MTVVSSTEIDATVAPDVSDPTETAEITIGNSSNGGAVSARTQILGNQIQCDPSLNCTQKVISTTDGSTPPTQTVVAGQTIKLTTPALPSGVTATSTTWTVGGTNIGERVFGTDDSEGNPISASASPTVLTNPSLTTYWLYPNASVPVTFKYCTNIQGANPVNQCSLFANATFNVSGPTAQITALLSPPSATGVWWVSPPTCGNAQYLDFGVLEPGCVWSPINYGIAFEAANVANVPAGGGQFAWTQIITTNVVDGTAPSGVVPLYQGIGLDTSDPYTPTATNPIFMTADAPGISLTGTNLTTENLTFWATMYLLWSSNVDPNSINVPLGYVSWDITGTADYSASATPPWSLDPVQVPASATFSPSYDDGTSTHGLPTWSSIFNSTPPVP